MTVRELHDAAMRKAVSADRLTRKGRRTLAASWYRFAARQETMAFELLPAEAASEPIRAILGLSAASLWWLAGKNARAIAVIQSALPTATVSAVPDMHRHLVDLLRDCDVAMPLKGEGRG